MATRSKQYAYYTFMVAAFIVTVAAAYFVWSNRAPHKTKPDGVTVVGGQGKCDQHKCGALDPVSDPAYNMKNVVKQSILLEEHLAEDRKYCKDCVCKHFQHILGLVEEAEMLAGQDIERYPKLKASADFYESQFNSWHQNRDSDAQRRRNVSALRDWRKDLMQQYILKA